MTDHETGRGRRPRRRRAADDGVMQAVDRRGLLLGGLAGLLLPAVARGAARDEAPAAAPPACVTVVLVRHAEKQAGDDPELTDAGRARARWLSALLAAAPVALLVHSPTRRAAQTLAPLAEATGLAPVVADPRDVGGLAERLARLPAGAVAVVAGHSNTLPASVAALGGAARDLDARGWLPDDAYDRLFVLTVFRGADGPATTSTLELRMPVPA